MAARVGAWLSCRNGDYYIDGDCKIVLFLPGEFCRKPTGCNGPTFDRMEEFGSQKAVPVVPSLDKVERPWIRPILVVVGDVHWIPEDLETMLRCIVVVCIQTAKIVKGLPDFRRIYLRL